MCGVNIYPGNCPACRQDTNLCGWHLRSVITLGCRLRQPPVTLPSHNSKVWLGRTALTALSCLLRLFLSPSIHRLSRGETLMRSFGLWRWSHAANQLQNLSPQCSLTKAAAVIVFLTFMSISHQHDLTDI